MQRYLTNDQAHLASAETLEAYENDLGLVDLEEVELPQDNPHFDNLGRFVY